MLTVKFGRGAALVLELDERLRLRALIVENILDARPGKNMQLPLPDLLRQFLYSWLAGFGRRGRSG